MSVTRKCHFYGLLVMFSSLLLQPSIAQDNPINQLSYNENIHCVYPVAKKERASASEVWCGINDSSSHPSVWFSADGKSNLYFMPWLSEGQSIGGVSVSDSGKYLAIVHIGEGHPYLVVYNIEKVRNAESDMHEYHFNPYPGSVGLYRWDGDSLLIETDYPVGKKNVEENTLNNDYIIYSVDIKRNKLKPVGRRTITQ